MNNNDNKDIAVLQEQMRTMKEDVTDIKADVKSIIKSLDDQYVKRSEFQQFKFITTIGVIIITGVVTALVTFYFNHRVKDTSSTSQTTTSSTPATASTPASSSSSTTTTNTPATPATASPGGSVNVNLPQVLK